MRMRSSSWRSGRRARSSPGASVARTPTMTAELLRQPYRFERLRAALTLPVAHDLAVLEPVHLCAPRDGCHSAFPAPRVESHRHHHRVACVDELLRLPVELAESLRHLVPESRDGHYASVDARPRT